jgi:pyrroline-5-carboxylate reductase
MIPIQLVGTAPAYLEAVIQHWTDLGLDTSIPEKLATQAGTLQVSHRFGEHRYEVGP